MTDFNDLAMRVTIGGTLLGMVALPLATGEPRAFAIPYLLGLPFVFLILWREQREFDRAKEEFDEEMDRFNETVNRDSWGRR